MNRPAPAAPAPRKSSLIHRQLPLHILSPQPHIQRIQPPGQRCRQPRPHRRHAKLQLIQPLLAPPQARRAHAAAPLPRLRRSKPAAAPRSSLVAPSAFEPRREPLDTRSSTPCCAAVSNSAAADGVGAHKIRGGIGDGRIRRMPDARDDRHAARRDRPRHALIVKAMQVFPSCPRRALPARHSR